jgi:hypothetical protein
MSWAVAGGRDAPANYCYLPYAQNLMIAKTLRPDTLVGARGLYFIPQLPSADARAALLDMLAIDRPLVDLLPPGNPRSTPLSPDIVAID